MHGKTTIKTYMHIHSLHTYIRPHTHINILTYIHKYTHIRTLHTHIHTCMHTYIHTYTHTLHTYIRTHAHTHTHTHTRTTFCVLPRSEYDCVFFWLLTVTWQNVTEELMNCWATHYSLEVTCIRTSRHNFKGEVGKFLYRAIVVDSITPVFLITKRIQLVVRTGRVCKK